MKKTISVVLFVSFMVQGAGAYGQIRSEELRKIGPEYSDAADIATWNDGGDQASPITSPSQAPTLTAQNPQYTFLSKVTYPDYPIQPHTILHITLRGDEPQYEDPGLTLKVSTRGTIKFPYIGEVKVTEMTENQVAKKIEDLLQKDYVRSPEVTVSVIANPGYWLMGAVQMPGRYDMTMDREMTLIEAIELAGGFRERQDISLFRWGWTYIRVTRTEGGERHLYEFKLDTIPEEFVVKPDDIIICRYGEMPELGSFYIFGEITNPGRYPIVPDDFSGKKLFRFSTSANRYIEILGASNVVDAVFNAQLLSPNAARNWVWLVRVENGRKTRYKIPMGKIYYKGDLTKNIRLKDGDVITVSESWF